LVQPPPPTTYKPVKPADDPDPRRGAFVPMLIGLLVIAGVAMYVVWEDMTPSRIQHQVTGEMSGSGVELASMDGSLLTSALQGPATGFAVSDLLSISGADKSLLTEPAGLPTPESSDRIAGLTRTDGTIAEEFVIWDIPGTVEAALTWYTHAAAEQTFEPLNAWSGTHAESTATSRVFVKSAGSAGRADDVPADQVLVVRARPLDGERTRVLVWLRHPVRGKR